MIKIMKKIISIILSAVLLVSALSCPLVVSAEESTENIIETKQDILQRLRDTYGDDLFSDKEDTYSWDFNILNELVDVDKAFPVIGDSTVSPQWGNKPNDFTTHKYGTHGYIIKEASYYSDVKISKTYIDLVYEICKLCDTAYGVNHGDNFCTAFHGNGNYIASLQYLWTFAKRIGKNKVNNAVNDSIITTSSKEALSTINSTVQNQNWKGSKKVITSLANKSVSIVKKYYKKTSSSLAYKSGQSEPGRCKYIVFGMICHCIGDIYAHKVMLKPSAAKHLENPDGVTWKKATMLKYSDFYSYYNMTDLIANIQGNSICTSQIKEYIKEKYTNDEGMSKKLKEIKDKLNKDYVDSPYFYPERIDEAIAAIVFFLQYYGDNFEDNYDASIYAQSCIESGNFTLYQFDKYWDDLIS